MLKRTLIALAVAGGVSGCISPIEVRQTETRNVVDSQGRIIEQIVVTDARVEAHRAQVEAARDCMAGVASDGLDADDYLGFIAMGGNPCDFGANLFDSEIAAVQEQGATARSIVGTVGDVVTFGLGAAAVSDIAENIGNGNRVSGSNNRIGIESGDFNESVPTTTTITEVFEPSAGE